MITTITTTRVLRSRPHLEGCGRAQQRLKQREREREREGDEYHRETTEQTSAHVQSVKHASSKRANINIKQVTDRTAAHPVSLIQFLIQRIWDASLQAVLHPTLYADLCKSALSRNVTIRMEIFLAR